jgi:hypothetical protein
VRGLAWRQPERRAIVVASQWGEGEQATVVRAVAGVLAVSHRVRVVALDGEHRPLHRDGAFDVETVALPPGTESVRAVVQRALAQAASREHRPQGRLPEPAATVLSGHRAAGWAHAARLVDRLRPDLVVLARPDGAGAASVLAAADAAATRTAVLPLTGAASIDPVTAGLCRRAGVVLATSPTETDRLTDADVPAVTVGVHLPANPFAVREPPAMLPAGQYVAVVDQVLATGDSATAHQPTAATTSDAVAVAGWLQAALDPVVVAAVDGADLVTWERGHQRRHPVVTSRADLWRILAFARCAVAVQPGAVLARSVLESLLHGTPVVTRAGTLAADHVQRASGGMVVTDDAGTLAAVQVLLDHADLAETAGAAGQRWANAHFGDLTGFVTRLSTALDLGPVPTSIGPVPTSIGPVPTSIGPATGSTVDGSTATTSVTDGSTATGSVADGSTSPPPAPPGGQRQPADEAVAPTAPGRSSEPAR